MSDEPLAFPSPEASEWVREAAARISSPLADRPIVNSPALLRALAQALNERADREERIGEHPVSADAILFCPSCGLQHLDIGEYATLAHRKHLCSDTPHGVGTGCGHQWQPSNYCTRGVHELTSGVAGTVEHVHRIRQLLCRVVGEILRRGLTHDLSKTQSPELETFEEFTPKLKTSEYGSEEYRGFLKAMAPALANHYARNRHHPEHHAQGVDGMDVCDLVETIVDWQAAGERHADGGSLTRSVDINKERFGLSDQLCAIIKNSAKLFG
jgi:hypothetical protein